MNDNDISKAGIKLEVQTFKRAMALGEGAARHVYARALGRGEDAIMAEIVVYNLVEGFSRAAGNPPGNPSRFHEHLHRNVGAALPEGLEVDLLEERAEELMSGEEIDGMTVAEMEEYCLAQGARLHEPALAPAPGL